MLDYPFWVNDFDRVRDHRITHPSVAKIFEHPVAFWYGAKRNKNAYAKLKDSLKRLLNRTSPKMPYFVLYNLPNRDIGQYSKGGATDATDYLLFLQEFCAGIKGHKPIVIFEPDALPHTTLMTPVEAQYRINLMKEGIRVLTEESDALVYIDVGHSNWLSPEQASELISSVSNSNIRGFSVNVSNYRSTEESMKWALKVCEYNEDWHFVIDTSRNGNGPHGNDWCNPPGRALGKPPTCDTGEEKCDAFLWIKIPGESDGTGNGGPRAGRFWPEMGSQLIENNE
jgi:endoglucanase